MKTRTIGLATLLSTLLLATSVVRAAEPTPTPAPAKAKGAAEATTPGKNPVVEVKTSLGSFDLELDPQKAPVTVKNFLDYVQAGHYDGTIFHRVIRDFMIQGGGMTPDMHQKPTNPPIKNEADNGLKNTVGTVAMARTNVVDSATCQFFVNTEDAKVAEYLRKFTFHSRPEIEDLETRHAANPGAREAHKALARAVTALVHGETECANAQRATEIMFGGGLEGISEALFRDVVGEIPTKSLARATLAEAGLALTELLVQAGLATSKGQARKDVEGGGIYLNNVRVGEVSRAVATADLLFGKYLLLRKGKRTYVVVEVA